MNEEQRDIYQKILEASNIISQSSRRSPANYIVTSPDIANMIQDIYNQKKSGWRKDKIKKLFPDE